MLLQINKDRNTRTWLDGNSQNAAMGGKPATLDSLSCCTKAAADPCAAVAALFSYFERQLKMMYPNAAEISYEMRDVAQWLDSLVEASAVTCAPATLLWRPSLAIAPALSTRCVWQI